ncbi:Uncharacterized hydrolase yutF [Listeria grayi]|uniref:Acid sugar phosphatase n=1 Tax=Listeria grayi FSL F6-1183 TaxID=1265827 RepID=A0A829R2G1_LISGR|nr:TIGR01457 family HAD-type hydrolase [Listeria grayi]EUJ25904.1 putative hydrolase yutF [Listeria grayi FSL F6-1183]VEI36047.1 Uncharacterized hydrolase yutF [Listeria grayi]
MITKTYGAYLIDLDGTMYRGSEKIPEAPLFVKELLARNIPHLFVTNNSTKTPEQVAATLNSMDIPAKPENIFTSSLATAQYMTQLNQGKTAYVIGEAGLKEALQLAGFEEKAVDPDFVVVGMDREVNYEKLATAALAIRGGATFISTNRDRAIPTEKGLMPGNGAITGAISLTTGVEPTFIGKPEAIIVEQALERLGIGKEQAIMVGDNYETDISAGIQYGMDTVIVHTGFTSPEELREKPQQPTYAIADLSEWQF